MTRDDASREIQWYERRWTDIERRIETLEAERDKLREALGWYSDVVSNCNRRGSEGEIARNALAQDIGKRARAALKEIEQMTDKEVQYRINRGDNE